MILLNTTFLVHKSIEREFIDWVHNTYIPTAVETGIFSDPLLSKVMIETDPEGTSYAVQMRAESHNMASQWHDNEAATLKNSLVKSWGEKVLHFTTFMEVIPR